MWAAPLLVKLARMEVLRRLLSPHRRASSREVVSSLSKGMDFTAVFRAVEVPAMNGGVWGGMKFSRAVRLQNMPMLRNRAVTESGLPFRLARKRKSESRAKILSLA